MSATLKISTSTHKTARQAKPDAREAAAAWLRHARGILEQIARDARRLHAASKRKGHPLFGLLNSHELPDAASHLEDASSALLNVDSCPPCPIELPDPVPGFDIDE